MTHYRFRIGDELQLPKGDGFEIVKVVGQDTYKGTRYVRFEGMKPYTYFVEDSIWDLLNPPKEFTGDIEFEI